MRRRRQRLLVAFDFGEPARAALAEAERSARGTGAELVLLHVFPTRVTPGEYAWKGGDAQRKQEQRALLDLLEREAADARSLRVLARVRTAEGDPVTAILETAAEERVTAIYVGADAHDGLAGALLGRIAAGVVRQATVPVLVVRRRSAPSPTDPVPDRRIVVGVDFSPASNAAVEAAESLALGVGGELRLVHVLPSAVALEEEDLACLRTRLEDLAAEVQGRGLRASATLAYGDPATALIAEVERDPAGVVAVGTRNRSRVARIVLGSVAESVLRRAGCSVLIAHSGSAARPMVGLPLVGATFLFGW